MEHPSRKIFTDARAPRASQSEIDAVMHPHTRYDRPADVLADPSLSNDERRAILSAWASDACAVPSQPVLRLPAFATRPVTFDEIMDALRDLDRAIASALTPCQAQRRTAAACLVAHQPVRT